VTALRRTPRRSVRAPARLDALILACSLGPLHRHQGPANDADAAALRASQAAVGRSRADYRLVDATTARSTSPFRGRPLVLSFVYTNCYASARA
jgi:cytochrome oxidase Cu insertion factor (SCO1/SenC/PrrC family)